MMRIFTAATYELESSLGEDITKLKLRVGFHSGKLTAGVLRSDKGRFQLFGDTVNTASRMESTGTPGRIQLSSDTAELLKHTDIYPKLSMRYGGVEAKGKGILQTYWLEDYNEVVIDGILNFS